MLERPTRPLIKRWLSSVRWYAKNMANWALHASGRAAGNTKVAHIDIRDNLWHRYLHILLIFLRVHGYAIELRHRWRFVGDWASSELFRRVRPDRITFSGPSRKSSLIISDRKDMPAALQLDADYFPLPGEVEHGYRVPMPMADSAYLIGVHAAPVRDAEETRQHAVFFFGNMESEAYSRSDALSLFGCMHRAQLLDFVKGAVPERVHEPSDAAGLEALGGKDIVLMDRARHYITPDRLPQTLSRFDFFLAPSGVVMPLCHNLTEALFAGCIPILQHAHLLDPPLEHGVHCLRFRDERELLAVLDQARDMTAQEVKRMRREVMRYYTAHLAPEAVVGRLEGMLPGRVRLNGEAASVSVLRHRLMQGGFRDGLPLPSEKAGT